MGGGQGTLIELHKTPEFSSRAHLHKSYAALAILMKGRKCARVVKEAPGLTDKHVGDDSMRLPRQSSLSPSNAYPIIKVSVCSSSQWVVNSGKKQY